MLSFSSDILWEGLKEFCRIATANGVESMHGRISSAAAEENFTTNCLLNHLDVKIETIGLTKRVR